MTKILLIRHALTDSVGKNLSGRAPGVLLNEEGRHQARILSERLSHVPLEAIYCSPLERALQTAGAVAGKHKLSCILSEDFLEIDFGRWTRLSFDELKNDPVFQNFNTFRSCTRIPEGETILEAQLRIINGIEKAVSKHKNKTIAIVSHSDMIKAAIGYYAGIPLDMVHRIEISPASVSVIEFFEDALKILSVNDTGTQSV